VLTRTNGDEMKAPVIGVRVAPEILEELQRLARANNKSQSEIARLLIEDSLARRAEEITDTQFQLVENRMAYMEKRFSGWMIKLARAIAESLYYSEQMATIDLASQDKELVNEQAQKFVRDFMKMKHQDVGRTTDDSD